MSLVFLVKLTLQSIILWNTVLFLPIILILCYFKGTRNILQAIYVKSGLNQTKDFLRRWAESILFRQAEDSKKQLGYALMKENGRYLDPTTRNLFSCQLYDYLSRKFLYYQSLQNKKVLEVQCGQMRGIEHISKNLGARCLAIHHNRKIVDEMSKGAHAGVEYREATLREIDDKAEKFDCIILINSIRRDEIKSEAQQISRLLKQNGYVCIAELLQNTQIKAFQESIQSGALRIVKSENLSKNVIQAHRIDVKRQQTECSIIHRKSEIKVGMWLAVMAYLPGSKARICSSLQESQKYIGYVLENREDA